MRRARWNSPPAEVLQARDRFERWRRTRAKRTPIPQPLWIEAARLAKHHGVHPVARALGLNDQQLRRRLDTAPASRSSAGLVPYTPAVMATMPPASTPATPPASTPERACPPGFVELSWAHVPPMNCAPPSPPRCVVELHETGGNRLTITLHDLEGQDLPELVRALRSTRP
jgi:hypothetical protein